MLEKVPYTNHEIDRAQVTSVQFSPGNCGKVKLEPNPFAKLKRFLLGGEPLVPEEVPLISLAPQVRYTIVGGTREYTVALHWKKDEIAADIARWLKREQNRFDGFVPTHEHYKGGLYAEFARGRHTETEERMVAYRSEDGRVWFRPETMFDERLPDGTPRFQKLPGD